MKRNVRKAIDQGDRIIHNNPRIDITVAELNEYYEEFKNNDKTSAALFNLISNVYRMGVAVGMRNAKQGVKRNV